jgi:hypothetical protein
MPPTLPDHDVVLVAGEICQRIAAASAGSLTRVSTRAITVLSRRRTSFSRRMASAGRIVLTQPRDIAEVGLTMIGEAEAIADQVCFLRCRVICRSSPQSRSKHQPQCRDSEPCFRSTSVRAGVELPAGCQCFGRSVNAGEATRDDTRKSVVGDDGDDGVWRVVSR